jgi:hypothetical protein
MKSIDLNFKTILILTCFLVLTSCHQESGEHGFGNDYFGTENNNLKCQNKPIIPGVQISPQDFFEQKLNLEFEQAYSYSETRLPSGEAESNHYGRVNSDYTLLTNCIDTSRLDGYLYFGGGLIPEFKTDYNLSIKRLLEVSFSIGTPDAPHFPNRVTVSNIVYKDLESFLMEYRSGNWTGAQVFQDESYVYISYYYIFAGFDNKTRYQYNLISYKII